MGRDRTNETEPSASDGTPPAPGEEDAAPGRKKRKVTKTEAVRRALKKLGNDAANTAIQEFVRRRYQHEMELPHISSCKSTLLKAMRQEGEPTPPAPAPAPRQAKPAEVQFTLAELGSIREMVERMGVKKFREALDFLYP